MNNGVNVANQLRFITLQQNPEKKAKEASGKGAAQNYAAFGYYGVSNTQNPVVSSKDTVEISKTQDKWSSDDGKISGKEKLINFGKGVISPVTAMFSSPKNFALGAAGIIGSGLLIAATGGAAAPVMVAAGVIGGGFGLLKSGYAAMTAKTDDDARKAWQGIGLGTTVTAGSIAGSKAALKSAGVDTKGMNILSATAECFKSAPAQIGKSVTAFTSGKAIANIKNALHIKNKKDETKPETKDAAKEAKKADKKDLTPDTESETVVKPDDIEPRAETGAAIEEGAAGAGEAGAQAADGDIKTEGASKPRRPVKPRRKRKSRIKHNVDKKQAQQVKQEVKDIASILDDFAQDNNVDTQFRNKIEDVRRIAQSPMENQKQDVTDLIGAIRQLESCRDNPQSIAAEGKTVDFPFDEAISYIEQLLSRYGVEKIQAAPGDPFNSRLMQAVNVKETNNPTLKDTIFEILFSGFKKEGKPGAPSDWKMRVGKYAAPAE